MKADRIQIFLVMLVLLSVLSVSCKKTTPVLVNPEVPPITNNAQQPPDNTVEPPPTFPEIELIPDFEIIQTTKEERGDFNETLYVLIPPVDLSLKNHVIQVKNLVKKLVVYDKRSEHISILIFDDRSALDKVFQDGKTTDLNVPIHYLARYDGNKEGLTYQFSLLMFPIAPESNSVVLSMQEEIEFDPYNW
jgi:hypothetical protein